MDKKLEIIVSQIADLQGQLIHIQDLYYSISNKLDGNDMEAINILLQCIKDQNDNVILKIEELSSNISG